MAGRPRNPNRKVRVDTGTKRGSYNMKHDSTGKTFKENIALKSFWSFHKMEDIKLLTSTELDEVIDKWITNYESTQLKRNPFWWYPEISYDPSPKVRTRKVNTKFNSSFRTS